MINLGFIGSCERPLYHGNGGLPRYELYALHSGKHEFVGVSPRLLTRPAEG